jgi:hypothetical protein
MNVYTKPNGTRVIECSDAELATIVTALDDRRQRFDLIVARTAGGYRSDMAAQSNRMASMVATIDTARFTTTDIVHR